MFCRHDYGEFWEFQLFISVHNKDKSKLRDNGG